MYPVFLANLSQIVAEFSGRVPGAVVIRHWLDRMASCEDARNLAVVAGFWTGNTAGFVRETRSFAGGLPPAKTLKPVYYTGGVREQLSLCKPVSHHPLGRLGDREPAGVPVLGSWPLGRVMFIHNF